MKDQPLPPALSFQCPKRWDELRVDGSPQRFCDHCHLHVHDLSALTRREGAALLAQGQGHTCVSFRVRADGSMVTRTAWGSLARRWQNVRQGALALLAMLTPFSMAACNRDQPSNTTLMGRSSKPCVAPAGPKNPLLSKAKNAPDYERVVGTPAQP